MGFMRRALGLPEQLETRASSSSSRILPPARAASSRVVNVETALGLSGIFRAIAILATSVGQLELSSYRRGREVSPAPLLIQRPDVDRSRRSFLKRTTIDLAASGNAYWRVFRDPAGRVSTIRCMDPLRIGVGRDTRGRRYFDYRELWETETRRLRPVTDQGRSGDVLHLRLLEIPGLELGLGPIQACRASLAGGLDLRDYSENFFSAGDTPTGVLSTNQQLNKDDADRYRDRWEESQAGRRGVAVLGAGLSYEPVLLKPADAQFLESRQFSITEQARMMGIPAPLLLAEINGSAMTYQNMEHVDLQLMKHTVMDYLNVIEDGLSELLPAGQTAQFRPFASLRSDNKTRAEINEIYVRMGVKTPEQVALEEGLPIPSASSSAGGDQLEDDQADQEGATA